MFLAIALPYRRRASAAGNVNHLLIEMSLRPKFSSRWNFTDISVRRFTGAIEANEGGAPSLKFPRRNFQLFDVLHMKPAYDWDALSRLPLLIGVDARRLGLVQLFYVERHGGRLLPFRHLP